MSSPSEHFKEEKHVIRTRLNPIARSILQGVYDPGSSLSALLGIPHVLLIIWKELNVFWKKCIKVYELDDENPSLCSHPYINISFFPTVFPKSSDININMMPFVMGLRFHDCYLPSYVEPYWKDFISKCIFHQNRFCRKSQIGKIWYLTIHESFVEKNTSQRRPGIHTECPGFVKLIDSDEQIETRKGDGSTMRLPLLRWGLGFSQPNHVDGGIYMASNVFNSCQVWDCTIDADGNNVIGNNGDIEHLRNVLPEESHFMAKGHIYWLTDLTPHESLPVEARIYRQYFRIVTSDVSLWHEDHSTKNPLGIVPDQKITKTVKGSKFDGAPLMVVKNVKPKRFCCCL